MKTDNERAIADCSCAVALAVMPAIRAQSRPGQLAARSCAQTQAEADAKSAGCLTCHNGDRADARLGRRETRPAPIVTAATATPRRRDAAHVKPLHPEIWKTSANPQRTLHRAAAANRRSS